MTNDATAQPPAPRAPWAPHPPIGALLRMADETLFRCDAYTVRELWGEALGYGRGMLDAANGGQPAVSDDAAHFAYAYAQAAYDHANGVRSRPAIWTAWRTWQATGTV